MFFRRINYIAQKHLLCLVPGKPAKGSFKNYINSLRWVGGQPFVYAYSLNGIFYLVNQFTWGRQVVKNGQNLVYVVIEWPQREEINQVQAVEIQRAAHKDFFKSETNGDIKIIITHHLYNYKRGVFSTNLEDVAQKIRLPDPTEV